MLTAIAFSFSVWLAQLYGYPSYVATKPAVPSNVYLGVYANTVGKNATNYQREQAAEALEATMGRTFAIQLHYYKFSTLIGANIQADKSITGTSGDVSHHRMPFIAWPCGTALTNYSSGAENSTIDAAAFALKQLNVPVGFRLFYEFNDCLTASSCANGYSKSCFNSSYTNAQKGAEFITAWEYIYNRFQTDGATNVAFVWDPSGPPGDISPTNILGNFVPPSSYVDWVGFDCYDKLNEGFSAEITPFYSWFTSTYPSYGKPMMLEETGEINCATSGLSCSAPAEWNQAQYWSDIASDAASSFPQIHAIAYFDATTTVSYPWILDAGGISYMSTAANTSYFEAMGY